MQLRQPVETVDPFEESFAEEETLVDRFAPVVAHQNHLSLDVTSSDLEAIKPLDENPAESLAGYGQQIQIAAQSLAQAPANPVEEQTPASPAVQVIESSEPTNFETETPPEPKPEREPNRDAVTDNAEEIEREAEAILERLRKATVSHETEAPPEHAPNLAESLASEHKTRDLDESQKVLQEILSQKSMLASSRTQSDQPEASADPPGTDSVAPPTQSASQPQQSINIEYPVATPSPESQPRRDDSEMLIVSRMEQKLESPPPSEPAPVPFPDTPVSKGRAQRMDYQQLFDQLRDISKD